MEIKITVSTNKIGSEVGSIIEIDYEDIIGLSDEEVKEYINECVIDEILGNGLIDWTWGAVDHD